MEALKEAERCRGDAARWRKMSLTFPERRIVSEEIAVKYEAAAKAAEDGNVIEYISIFRRIKQGERAYKTWEDRENDKAKPESDKAPIWQLFVFFFAIVLVFAIAAVISWWITR